MQGRCFESPRRHVLFGFAPGRADHAPAHVLDAIGLARRERRRFVEALDGNGPPLGAQQAIASLGRGIEVVEGDPRRMLSANRGVGPTQREGDLDDIADPNVGDEEGGRQATVEHQPVEVGLAPKDLEAVGLGMLDALFPAHDANEMHFGPLVQWVVLDSHMCDLLGAGASEDAPHGANVPRILCPRQVDLGVVQQAAEAVADIGFVVA